MSTSYVEFRQSGNIRALPDIRRSVLWPETVLSQYDNSPIIKALARDFETEIDPAWDIEWFYRLVFNPLTAIGWGLDVWGRIVGIGRVQQLRGDSTRFGFLGSNLQPFNQGPFADSSNITHTYVLPDEPFRQLIFFKAAINICDGTIPTINKLLRWMFKDRDGTVMVLHTGTMHIRYLFSFYLSDYEQALILRQDIPPAPAGVGYDVYEVNPAMTFGFDGSGLQPFNQGNFVRNAPLPSYSID